MFITSLAPNLLALELVNKTAKISISWTEWFIGFLPVGVILFSVLPYLIYKIYPPEIKASGEVQAWASQELGKMGKFTRKELVMALLAILALTLWIFGGKIVDATTVAGVVISLMVITGSCYVGRYPEQQSRLECPCLVCHARGHGRRPQ